MTALVDEGFSVSLKVAARFRLSRSIPSGEGANIKTPDSAEVHRNLWENIAHLQPQISLSLLCVVAKTLTGRVSM